MIWRQRRPLWAPVATSNARRGRRSRRGSPSLQLTSGLACGAVGGQQSTSGGHDLLALHSPAPARGPLKTTATAIARLTRLPLSSKIDGRIHGRGTYLRMPEKEIRRRSRSRDENPSSRLRLRRRSWCLRYLEVPPGEGPEARKSKCCVFPASWA